MFVYGTAYGGDGTRYESICLPALLRSIDDDDVVIACTGELGLSTTYNDILDYAWGIPDCEGVVLLHDDVEVCDPLISQKLRRAFRNGHVGVVGVIGGKDLRTMEWWTGRQRVGTVVEGTNRISYRDCDGEVDSVDGLLLGISLAARKIRFDSQVAPRYHGYDADFCLSARAMGLTVLVEDVDLVHHTKGTLGDVVAFRRAVRAVSKKHRALLRRRTFVELMEAVGARASRWKPKFRW